MNVNLGFSSGKKGTENSSGNKEYCMLSSETQESVSFSKPLRFSVRSSIKPLAFCLKGESNLEPLLCKKCDIP